jgi:hypothetical protein
MVVMRVRLSVLLIIGLLTLTACGNLAGGEKTSQEIYRPPSAVPTSSEWTPTLMESELAGDPGDPQPTPTPSCSNNLMFLDDLTIPDGTLVNPRDQLDKRWLIRNNGTCNWNDQYRVRLIAGPGMGVPVQQALYPALSNTEVVIRMVFIAPEEPGNHRSAWQAYDPNGDPFGDLFFIDIVVLEE